MLFRGGQQSAKLLSGRAVCCQQQCVRFKWILKRENEPLLGLEQTSPYIVGPFVKEIRSEDPWQFPRAGIDNVYQTLGNTTDMRKLPIRVLLIDHVPGIGLKGDIVEVNRQTAFHELLPAQKAVYASDKNLKMYHELIENKSSGGPSSVISALTAVKLSQHRFLIEMSGDKKWELEAWHVRAAMRKQGLQVPLSAIELPTSKIKGPNLKLESKVFFVAVTINNNPDERIQVQCLLHHIGQELMENWVSTTDVECLLPDQQSLLELAERLRQSLKSKKPHYQQQL